MDMHSTLASAATLRNAAHQQDPQARTAVVAWYGYDFPASALTDGVQDLPGLVVDLLASVDDRAAAVGGDLLAADMARFTAMVPSSSLVTLVGHSMGSTVSSLAAARHDFRADNLVMMGAPGAGTGVGSADEYRSVTAGHVYVLASDTDVVTYPMLDLAARATAGLLVPLTRSEPYGPDPNSPGFHAERVDLTAATDPPSTFPLNVLHIGVDSHPLDKYLSGTGLAATAQVVTGQYRRVPTGSRR